MAAPLALTGAALDVLEAADAAAPELDAELLPLLLPHPAAATATVTAATAHPARTEPCDGLPIMFLKPPDVDCARRSAVTHDDPAPSQNLPGIFQLNLTCGWCVW
jgi:hypothetical protein